MSKKSIIAVAALSAALLLSGCAQESTEQTAAPYTEPAWMAEVRQMNETYQAGMVACLEAEGIESHATSSGVVVAVNNDVR